MAILSNGKHAPRPLRARFRSTVPSLAGVARSWRAPCTRLAWADSSAELGPSKGEAAETFARDASGSRPAQDARGRRRDEARSGGGVARPGQCGPELAPSWPVAISDAAWRPQTLCTPCQAGGQGGFHFEECPGTARVPSSTMHVGAESATAWSLCRPASAAAALSLRKGLMLGA